MKLSARSAALYSATVAGLLMLSACGKNEPAAPAPAASSTAAAPASTAAAPAKTSTAAVPATSSTAPAAASTAAAVAPAATTAAAAPVAATDTNFRVSTVTLGDTVTPDHKVRKDTASFVPTAKTIYVSVDTDGSTAGSTLSAKWTYLEGKGQLVTSTSQSIVADGAATTTFKVQNPNLWPEGKYKVDISLDGKQVASKPFEVAKR